MHEKSEKLIPLHKHSKGQLSFVEGGIAYLTINLKTYVVPARHFFWIPKGVWHVLRIGYSATVLRSLYYYADDDHTNPFYTKLGIYPATELVIQMIKYTERWDGKTVTRKDSQFEFLVALKKMLPSIELQAVPLILPTTENEDVVKILKFLEKNLDAVHSLSSISKKFNLSERSLSRMFQNNLHISFLQYLKTLRIVKALELLLKTKKTVSEIAYEVGYETVGSFSNTFYAFTRMRPSELRKNANR